MLFKLFLNCLPIFDYKIWGWGRKIFWPTQYWFWELSVLHSLCSCTRRICGRDNCLQYSAQPSNIQEKVDRISSLKDLVDPNTWPMAINLFVWASFSCDVDENIYRQNNTCVEQWPSLHRHCESNSYKHHRASHNFWRFICALTIQLEGQSRSYWWD